MNYHLNRMLTFHNIRRYEKKVKTVMMNNPPISIKLTITSNCNSLNKGNNKITELRTILQRESQNS